MTSRPSPCFLGFPRRDGQILRLLLFRLERISSITFSRTTQVKTMWRGHAMVLRGEMVEQLLGSPRPRGKPDDPVTPWARTPSLSIILCCSGVYPPCAGARRCPPRPGHVSQHSTECIYTSVDHPINHSYRQSQYNTVTVVWTKYNMSAKVSVHFNIIFYKT